MQVPVFLSFLQTNKGVSATTRNIRKMQHVPTLRVKPSLQAVYIPTGSQFSEAKNLILDKYVQAYLDAKAILPLSVVTG